MKKAFTICSLLLSIFSFGQSPQGGQRIYSNPASTYGLTGITLDSALNLAGKIHNEYQESLLQTLSQLNPDFTDTVNLKSIISENSVLFFEQKGLSYNETYHSLNLATSPPSQLTIVNSDYSTEGYNLMNELQSKLDLFQANDDIDSLLSQLNLLKDSALKLSSESEVLTVGLPISVAINSFTYWKLNGQRWMDIFGKDDGTGDSDGGPSFVNHDKNLKKPKVNLYHLGGADLFGAINGAMAGGFAGAVLVSATASLGNLTNQVLGSYLSWWPW